MKTTHIPALCIIALLLAGCASTGSNDDAVKPRVGSTGYNPAKQPEASDDSVAKGSNDDDSKLRVPSTGSNPPQQPEASDASVPEVQKPPANDQWLPIVVVSATYPKEALDKGVEGYVILEYTVTKTGSLKDIVVIDSTPPNYFEWAAIEAASKFRYNPKIVNGEPVEVPRAQYKMIFKLEYLLPQ